jgi:hypothetical protein
MTRGASHGRLEWLEWLSGWHRSKAAAAGALSRRQPNVPQRNMLKSMPTSTLENPWKDWSGDTRLAQDVGTRGRGDSRLMGAPMGWYCPFPMYCVLP